MAGIIILTFAEQEVRQVPPSKKKKKLLPAEHYWQSIPWDVWWNEFMAERKQDGQLKYKTAWEFVKEKAGPKTYHRQLIWRSIGPPPIQKPAIIKNDFKTTGYEPPYLGDWQALRAQTYFYDNSSVEKLRVVIAERLDGLEAGRGGATLILDLISKWMRIDDKVDESFSLEALNQIKSATGKEAFFKRVMTLKNRTRVVIQDLITSYLQCHGISADGVSDLGQLVLSVSNASVNGTLKGLAAGAAFGGTEQVTAGVFQLAKAIQDKSKIFNIPLPASLMNGKHEEDIELEVPSKGNGNGHSSGS